jgi:hypothetical protein
MPSMNSGKYSLSNLASIASRESEAEELNIRFGSDESNSSTLPVNDLMKLSMFISSVVVKYATT